MGALVDQYRREIAAGTRNPADLAAAEMIERDQDSWREQLKQQAAQAGVSYDESDLQDVIRNVSYAGNAGKDPASFINKSAEKYRERAASDGGGGAESTDGGGDNELGFPYPERVAMPDPTQPTPYSSTYQTQQAAPFQGVGEAERNRLMAAILGQPETLGATQQAQLFEQQKELLNAQRAQQQSQLQQNMAARGITGGAFLAAQAGLNQDFSGQLLAAQRDVALKAAQQNRADQMAALEMQNAMAAGDFQRMQQIYQANQQERANVENFLRQAAELTQQGQLQYNAQRMAQAVAQQNEISDFYRFLEGQRQFEQNYGLDATRLGLGH